VRIDAVTQLSRGVSRETWAVDGAVDTAAGPRALELIVRRDHPAGSIIPSDLRLEYEVYRRLTGTQVPVASALWFEDDAQWQPDGRPAYLRERIEGHWRLPFLADDSPESDELKIAASREHLDKLALVHTLDWRARGFAEIFEVPSSAAEAGTAMVRGIRSLIEQSGVEPNPVMAEAAAFLIERAPRDAPCLTLCKGTNGHGEEVWRDGRIVALSDWELARIGDPAYDLSQVQEMVPEIVRDGRRVWGWPEALAYYTERSGIPISQERLDWYRACYGLLQFSYSAHSASAVRRMGDQAPLRFVWTALEISYHAERRMVQAVSVQDGSQP
jgi:aminoglycoside phosphotransferase (APT) family kinase protein